MDKTHLTVVSVISTRLYGCNRSPISIKYNPKKHIFNGSDKVSKVSIS